jgi:hypothetical protein
MLAFSPSVGIGAGIDQRGNNGSAVGEMPGLVGRYMQRRPELSPLVDACRGETGMLTEQAFERGEIARGDRLLQGDRQRIVDAQSHRGGLVILQA